MSVEIVVGDCREGLRRFPDNHFHTCITSPPYWSQRDYGKGAAIEWPDGWWGQLGNEPTVDLYVDHLVAIFREVRRVLRPDGTLWLNLGSTYAESGKAGGGLKPKDLCGAPWRVALALQADGWWLRQDIIWWKPCIKPESVKDRPTREHEYVFLLAKQPHYYYDWVAIREPVATVTIARERRAKGEDTKFVGGAPGQEVDNIHRPRPNDPERPVAATRNKRTVWRVAPGSFKGEHYSVYPPKLVEPMIEAGTSLMGCCSVCGAPLQRVLDSKPCTFNYRVREVAVGRGAKKNPKNFRATEKELGGAYDARASDAVYWHETVDWEPTCDCNAAPTPCRVLDPFGGSGTTALVAEKLGRDSVIIEIVPEFAAMAKERIAAEAGTLLTRIEVSR